MSATDMTLNIACVSPSGLANPAPRLRERK
jgi:hypothetical protein